jgi:hypothetical protein
MFLKEEIFARQPPELFKKSPRERRLLRNNLALFLHYRFRNLNGAQPLLPRFVHNVVEHLAMVLGDSSDEKRVTIMERICLHLANTNPNILSMIIDGPTESLRKAGSTDADATAIAAAVVIGDLKACKILILERKAPITNKPPLFRSPLDFLIKNRDSNTLWIILGYTRKSDIWSDLTARDMILSEAIRLAFSHEAWDLLNDLLEIYRQELDMFPYPLLPKFNSWMSKAIRSGREPLVCSLLEFDRHGWKAAPILIRRIVPLNDITLIQRVIDHGRTHPKGSAKRAWATEQLVVVLDKEFPGVDREKLVKYLLRCGADARRAFDTSTQKPSTHGWKGYKLINKMLVNAKNGILPEDDLATQL